MTAQRAPSRMLAALLFGAAMLIARVDAADAAPGALAAQPSQERLLCGFETAEEPALFELTSAQLSDQHATEGRHSLRVAAGGYLSSWRLPSDWSSWDTLEIDAFVEADAPVHASILVGDRDWRAHGSTYWNRHNRDLTLHPGANTIQLPVHGLWRGEAGSRANDLGTPIDPAHIVRFDLGIGAGAAGTAVYVDNLRLVRSALPPGLLAFAFGPPAGAGAGAGGFIPITWNTVHGAHGAASGLARACGTPNRARDDTFPTRLYQGSVWFEEDGNAFVADLPNGRWHGWAVFNDCGYWGGEASTFTRRTILADGAPVDEEVRALGPCDYLFRFEHVEPLRASPLWDLYVAPLFTPRRFTCDVADGRLRLSVRTDAPWSSRLAALVLYPDGQRAAAEAWLARLEAANRAEFDARAVCMDPARAPAAPEAAQARGWWLGYPALADDIAADGPPGPPQGELARAGVAGEPLAFTVALRPLRELGSVRLSLTDLSGPAGSIPASACELRFAQYQARRGSADLAYAIAPGPLPRVPDAGLRLSAGVTRAIWVIATIPADAHPGRYTGTLALAGAQLSITVPVAIEVLPLTLAMPDYPMGFFGAGVPAELPAARRQAAWAELARLLVRSGMTSLSGGPGIPLRGFAPDGTPQLDFGACDAYFATLASAGMRGPLYGYGGPGEITGLCDAHAIGDAGRRWSAQLGVDFPTVVRRVVDAVHAHAQAAHWPRIYRSFVDEPRTLAGAQDNLALAQAWALGAPADPCGGFYSVNWSGHSPLDAVIQRLFATLTWSGLNEHGQADLDQAQALRREVHIYNQGLDRYTFGEYQFAEWRKGVRGFMQWHTLCLHGWQFFDLDGREPDTGVVNWGQQELIPSLSLMRASAGAWDFRYAWTLWSRAHAHPELPAAQDAIAYLDGIARGIPAGARARPVAAPEPEAFRARLIALLEALLEALPAAR